MKCANVFRGARRPIDQDDPEFYEGKMYGADGVFGWFDDATGEGHVEAYGLPTYESADIVAARKPSNYISDAQLEASADDGTMTLTFTRTVEPPDIVNDVAIDATGSWIMWCLAPNGLFYPGQSDVMVTHTERHEAFIAWEDVGAYSDMATTPRPAVECASSPRLPLGYEVDHAMNNNTSCAGLTELSLIHI